MARAVMSEIKKDHIHKLLAQPLTRRFLRAQSFIEFLIGQEPCLD